MARRSLAGCIRLKCRPEFSPKRWVALLGGTTVYLIPESGTMIDNGAHEISVEELLGPLNDVEQKYAPNRLFIAGDREILVRGARVAIVGTREPSRDGALRAKKLARLLAGRNAVVVSGLARGIDTAAHQAAVEAGGKTVAVIGTPLDQHYPAENGELQQLIMREHLCISQFPPSYPAQPKNFPIRNRTMALVSDVVVIIEAGVKSGTINQGWEALRLGRGLFIARSLVENQALLWPRDMLNYGARELSEDSISEFLAELPERDPAWAENVFSF